ncbi:HEPACAM family member 2-like [Ambystoma mexicanum]|uniref:HEPACAM family member 2-like n=1 Tax=Ambystoma mexicanum TaxID=8296 RepID=UPI0037E70A00
MTRPTGPLGARLLLHVAVCWLLVFTGPVMGLQIVVPQDVVAGKEGHPVILQTSYRLSQPSTFLQIRWSHLSSSSKVITIHTIRNVSASNGSYALDEKPFIPLAEYRDRVTLFPRNGSLVIQKMLPSDQGLYEFFLKDSRSNAAAIINVTLFRESEQHATKLCACSGNSSSDGYPMTPEILVTMRVVSVLISTLFLLALHLTMKRQTPRKERRSL